MSFGAADSGDDFDDYDKNGADEKGFRWPTEFCSDSLCIRPNATAPGGASFVLLPLLTQCLQDEALSQIPPLFLLVTLPILWIQLSAARREQRETHCDRSLPRGILIKMRKGITIMLFGLKSLLLVRNCYGWLWGNENVPMVELLSPAIHLATLIVLCHYAEQCRSVGLVSPGPLFCTWLLFVVFGTSEFLFWLRNVRSADFVRLLVPLIWWPLCCLQLFLHLFSEFKRSNWDDEPNSSPEPRASFVSRIFFFWLDPLVWRGHRKPLAERDVFVLEPSLKAQRLFQRWTGERKRQKKLSHSRAFSADNSTDKNEAEERSPLLSQSSGPPLSYGAREDGSVSAPPPPPPPAPSIIFCLWQLFKWELIGATVVKLCSDLLQFVSPILLGQLITFTDDLSLPPWLGYLIAVCLFAASELRSLLLNNYFVLMNSVGCQIQSVLTSAVFAKTLRLSKGARRGRTSGEIQNLMAIDVDRFQQIMPILQQLWSSPLQIVVSLFLLYKTIGWAVVGGVTVMLSLIPCNLVVVRFTKRWQVEQMKCKDERLRMTNEVLSGIRAVKLNAWEVPMMGQIECIRRRETTLLRKSVLLRLITEVLNVTSPTLVAVLSFALFTLSDPIAHPLTPAIAFVSLTLFSQLRVPMMKMAELVSQMVQTVVSNRRLKEFLVAEEVEEGAVERERDSEYERAVDVEFASFDWQFKRRLAHDALAMRRRHRHSLTQSTVCLPYTLNNVELHLRRGILTAIVGKVGSGKSSLLNAILGEMHKVYGYVGIRGTVAYVPQQPWILNRTLRENIIFPVSEEEKPYEQHYAKVVKACALTADFSVLPNGDQTEIGEKGINLSGGQKARVNLARALYRRADIYLLDDPISAVDAIVGRHLFDHAIGPSSMSKGSTRILVTHSLAYLNQCDWIVVLDDGQIKSQGTFTDLEKEEETAKMFTRLDREENVVESATYETGESSDGESTRRSVKNTRGSSTVGETEERKSTRGSSEVGETEERKSTRGCSAVGETEERKSTRGSSEVGETEERKSTRGSSEVGETEERKCTRGSSSVGETEERKSTRGSSSVGETEERKSTRGSSAVGETEERKSTRGSSEVGETEERKSTRGSSEVGETEERKCTRGSSEVGETEERKSTRGSSSVGETKEKKSRQLRRRQHRISDRNNSLKRSISVSTTAESKHLKEAPSGKLVKAEIAETGRVRLSVYGDYFAAMRWPLFVGFVLFILLHFISGIVQSFWLSNWSDDNSFADAPSQKMPLAVRLGVYAAIGMATVVFLAFSYLFQVVGSVNASIRLHGPLLDRVLHAPVSFFDTTPLGRVLNRFGKEFDTVDLRLASTFRFLTISLLMVLQVMLTIAISTPLFVLIDIPISAIYILILVFFIPTSRQLQRLTSLSRSPLYNIFAETINGTTSIRAFGVSQAFFDKFCAKLDEQVGFKYFSLMINRWLSIRLELIGNFVILASSSLAVLSRQWGIATAGLIGLSVSRSLDITFMLAFLVRNANDFELSVISVERILEYMKCPQEAHWHSRPGEGPPKDWPDKGEIRLQNFSCRYRPELDLSLRSINAGIRPQEKAAEGRILIDQMDIAHIGLQELRSRLTLAFWIIPQDPVLFSGTLRFNLDPFDTYSDNELWAALEHVHMKEFVQMQRDKLSHQIAEGGENISVGQRQLLCLARAILRRSAIIVMDEATASIDSQTDALIQKTIRTEFQHSTVITIAHRISTVMDYDRIMVLSGGQLIEFDTPANLMANKESQFHELVKINEEQTDEAAK
ncbi:hypothetical protein niasHT_022904 [Heterodera trifolii]|uniref:Uncharacterized protein n=1 Tax=Heterodera trifolii TaxID=157864 RepID=A0ABD2KB12_9BILA